MKRVTTTRNPDGTYTSFTYVRNHYYSANDVTGKGSYDKLVALIISQAAMKAYDRAVGRV